MKRKLCQDDNVKVKRPRQSFKRGREIELYMISPRAVKRQCVFAELPLVKKVRQVTPYQSFQDPDQLGLDSVDLNEYYDFF